MKANRKQNAVKLTAASKICTHVTVRVVPKCLTCDQAFFLFFLKGRRKKITADTFIRPAAKRPLILIS